MSSRKKQSHAKKHGGHGTGTTMPKKSQGSYFHQNQPLFAKVVGEGRGLITYQLKKLTQELIEYSSSYKGNPLNFKNDLPSETKGLARTLLENINKSEADSLFITQSKQEYENIMNIAPGFDDSFIFE